MKKRQCKKCGMSRPIEKFRHRKTYSKRMKVTVTHIDHTCRTCANSRRRAKYQIHGLKPPITNPHPKGLVKEMGWGWSPKPLSKVTLPWRE